MSDKLKKFLELEIDKINTHLPHKPIPLHMIDKMKEPGYKLRDGEFTYIDIDELGKIKDMIPERYWKHILLPIIIIRRRDLGSGAFVVGGTEGNQYIIASTFDELPSFGIWRLEKEDDRIYYKPHIRQIRKHWPTTTVIGFT